jgi:hypothetical protein
MALLITDTHDGIPQGMPCAGMRGARLHAGAVYVGGREGLWHS